MSIAAIAHQSGAAAASQSTVFITMVDSGDGDLFVTNSIVGKVFGLDISSISYRDSTSTSVIDLAGSASGQSFFRSFRRASDGTSRTSAAATYNSGNNTWTYTGTGFFPGFTATLQFFR